MPVTVNFNALSSAYPTITNRIRASIYKESDPLALVASQTEDAPHPIRIWAFPGLPRDNYRFSLDEIDGSGNVVTNLALFDAVPSEVDGLLTRNDEQPQVGVTTGFVAGSTNFTFDGTGGKPNYVGWEIVPSELTGRGILVRGVDYSWDSATGTFSLLIPGDVFSDQTFYNIHFQPFQNPAGNSYPTLNDLQIKYVDSDYVMLVEDIGKKIIIEPLGDYLEITLLSLSLVPIGRKTMFEISGNEFSVSSVKFITNGADKIAFLSGDIIAQRNESFSLYKAQRPSEALEWRMCDIEGNFNKVGEIIFEDQISDLVYNKQILDGSLGDVNKHARIYKYISNLPIDQVVNFADWNTGNNKYKYSNANVDGEFHFPDRRDKYLRSTGNDTSSGEYLANQNKVHSHNLATLSGADDGFLDNSTKKLNANGGLSGNLSYRLQAKPPATTVDIGSSGVEGGTESRPETVILNQYVIL